MKINFKLTHNITKGNLWAHQNIKITFNEVRALACHQVCQKKPKNSEIIFIKAGSVKNINYHKYR